MEFDSIPQNYRSMFDPVYYGIYGCDPQQIVDVEIINTYNNKVLGVKRMKGNTDYVFNVAAHLHKAPIFYPAQPYQKPLIIAKPYQTAKIKIRIGTLESDISMLTAARIEVSPGTKLSNAPAVKRIARNEFDELSTIVRQANVTAVFNLKGRGESIDIDSDTVYVEHDLVTLSFGFAGMAPFIKATGRTVDEFDSMRVTLFANGNKMFSQDYVLLHENPNAVMVGWINTMGVVDCYSFADTVKKEINIKRRSGMAGQDEHKLYSLHTDCLTTLISEFETSQDMEWLSQILTSPKVWLLGENSYTPINIVTSEAVIKDGMPARLKITYQTQVCSKFQNIL